MSEMTSAPMSVPAVPQFGGYARFGYLSIAAVAAGFLGWSVVAPLSGAVIAPGKVQVEGEVKPVQHLEGGIVREILVKDATEVEQGDVVIRLETVQAQANLDTLQKQLDLALIQDARLNAERDDRPDFMLPPELEARRGVAETATAIADQRGLLREKLAAKTSELAIYDSRLAQSEEAIRGRRARLVADEGLMKSLSAELAQIMPLYEKKFVTLPRIRGVERERDRVKSEIEIGRSDIAKLDRSIEETKLLLEQSRQRQRDAVMQQIAETRAKISDLRERIAVARDVLSRTEVRAPRKGVLQELKVHAIGAVIRPGETIAQVVPVGEGLILAARVQPANVQDVAVGQKAEIRFGSLSKNLPPMYGHVESVSADAILDDATRQPIYLVRLKIDADSVPRHVAARLMPGLPCEVLILTGERTMFQYMIQPIADRFAKTMREK